MEVVEQTEGDALVLAISGRIDGKTAKAFEEKVTGALAASAGKVVIDCAGVDFISSAGLRVFLIAAKRLKASGRDLVVCGLQPLVQEIFETTGFYSILTVVPDRAAAL